MMCDLITASNFLLLFSLLNSSKYSRTSWKTSFFGTSNVIVPFSFSNSDVKFALSSNSTNMLYCSFALSVSSKFPVGASSGRSIWCSTDPQLSSSKCTKRAQFIVARLNTLLNTLCYTLRERAEEKTVYTLNGVQSTIIKRQNTSHFSLSYRRV